MPVLNMDEAEPRKTADGDWILLGRLTGTYTKVITAPLKDVPGMWRDGLYETVLGTKFDVKFRQP